MKSNICISCKQVISEHSRRENIECALKLCNWEEVADIACGADEQLDQKPTRSYRRSVSSC